MNLLEIVRELEKSLGRPLDYVEERMVMKMFEAGKELDEILKVVTTPVHIPTDDEIETRKFEAVGQLVVSIDNVPIPEETEDV